MYDLEQEVSFRSIPRIAVIYMPERFVCTSPLSLETLRCICARFKRHHLNFSEWVLVSTYAYYN